MTTVHGTYVGGGAARDPSNNPPFTPLLYRFLMTCDDENVGKVGNIRVFLSWTTVVVTVNQANRKV